jgi:dsRNA-specific ribonuclease
MVSVDIDGEFLGEGEGRTKKTAEQIAAGAAFDALADR